MTNSLLIQRLASPFPLRLAPLVAMVVVAGMAALVRRLSRPPLAPTLVVPT